MINLSWLVRKRKLRLTLEAIWVTTTSLTLSSHATTETFFFYCINELSYLRWGRKPYGPACTLPSNNFPYWEAKSDMMQGKKRYYLILLGEKRLGQVYSPFPSKPSVCSSPEGVQANRNHIFLRPWANLSSGQSDWQRLKGNKHLEGCLLKTLHCSRAKWLRTWRSTNHDLKL